MKLIIDISEELYNGIECRNPELETEYVCHELMKAVDNGTPLNDIKAEIEQFRESLAEKAPSLQDLINAQRTVDICLGIIDNVGKENKK